MNKKQIEELRQKYIKNPPEDMTAKLVRNMTDSDLPDMHYFLTEDDALMTMTLKMVFSSFKHGLFAMPAFCVSSKQTFQFSFELSY